jgi:hypothetical protein
VSLGAVINVGLRKHRNGSVFSPDFHLMEQMLSDYLRGTCIR